MFSNTDQRNIRDLEGVTVPEGHLIVDNNDGTYDILSAVTYQREKLTGKKADTGFKKYDGDKPQLHRLFTFNILEDVVDVMKFGGEKYGESNWRLNPSNENIDRYMSAALRHLKAYDNGEHLDKESGKPHLSHAICCLLFMATLDEDITNNNMEYLRNNQEEITPDEEQYK